MPICFPSDETAGSHNDCTAHTPKLEQRELDTFADGVAWLQTPAGVAISGQVMMLIGRRREGIRVGFSIGWRREGHEGVERSAVVGCERETIVDCGVNVVEDVEGSIPVAFGWFVVV